MRKLLKLRFLWSFLTLFLVLSLIIGGCGKKEKKEEAKSATKQEVAEEGVIKAKPIFKATAILPLTGNLAVIGKEEMDGMRLAVEDFSTKDFHLKLNFEDFRGDAKQAVSIFQKVISLNKPIAVFASTSVAVNVLLPLVKENSNQLIFYTITTQKNVVIADNVFRVWPRVTDEVNQLINFLNTHKDKRIILMYPTNELGMDAYKAFKNALRNRIILELPHDLRTTELRNDIEKIRIIPDLKDKILVAWTYPKQTLNILKRIEALNLKPSAIVTSIGTDFPPVIEYLKHSKLHPIFAVPKYEISGFRQKFETRFMKKFGYKPTWNVAAAYDTMTHFLLNLQKCYAKPNIIVCLKTEGKNLQFDGISGFIRMNGFNEAEFPMTLVTFNKDKGIVHYGL